MHRGPEPDPVTPTGPQGRWRGIALDLVVNVALPLIVFLLLRGPWGVVPALLASSVPPLVWSLVELIRTRRIDALSLIVLVGIGLSLLAFIGGGSIKALQLREKFATLAIGLAFLGSLAIDRPLIWYIARATEARKSSAAASALESKRGAPRMRRMMRVMTLVWGLGLVVEFAVSVALVYTLPIAEYLVVGPVIGYATMAGLGVWTFRYVREGRRRGEAAAAEADKTPPSSD